MISKNIILNKNEIGIILNRLACQLIENHQDFSNTILIGLQPNGKTLLNRLVQILTNKYDISELNYGLLDITFYRDDFRRSNKVLQASTNEMDCVVEGRNVVFVDDVLYTGRSIRAALTAIQAYGRPSSIELLILIDRRFSRHLPIQPDFRGRQVDAIDNEKVIVNWKETHGEDNVYLIKQ